MVRTRSKAKEVGDKFTLNCGVEVTLVEKIKGTLKVIAEDSQGRRKEVFTGALGTGEVSWEWDSQGNPTKSVGGRTAIGSYHILNCGVGVTVISLSPTVVKDCYGNTKEVSNSALYGGAVSWKQFGIPSSHKTSKQLKLMDFIKLTCGVTVQLMEYVGCETVRVEDSEGNSKWTAIGQLVKGRVSWQEFGHRTPSKIDKRVSVGDRRKSKKHGWYEIIEINSCNDIKIRWDDYLGVQSCAVYVIDTNTPKPEVAHWNYLQVNKEKYYVYIAIHNEEIAYVGKGTGDRYTHVNSGRSNNYFLNQHHFSGESLKVIIYRDGLTNEDAIEVEKMLILKHLPKYNTASKPKETLVESA